MIAYTPDGGPSFVTLTGCQGGLVDDGSELPCDVTCLAHFAAYTNPRTYLDVTGTVYNAYPNSILSAARFLPGSVPMKGALTAPGLHTRGIAVYQNHSFFIDPATDEPRAVWMVVHAPGDADLHFATAHSSSAGAWSLLQRMSEPY